MASKKDIQEMLVSMGFQPNYIQRAFKVYEKNYGHSYNVEVITEIIVRLQNKDKTKMNKKKEAQQQQQQHKNQSQSQSPRKDNKTKPKPPPKSPMKSSSTKPPKPKPKPPQPKAPKDKNEVNINMEAQKKHSNSNYRHNYSQSTNTNPHSNIGNPHAMKRNSSNPKPNHPIQQAQPIHAQYNANNQPSPPKIHAKNAPPHTYNKTNNNNKAARQSPRMASSNQQPQSSSDQSSFKPKDIVIYQNRHEAEVMRVLSENQYEITYPTSTYVLQRTKARVYGRELKKKRVKFNIQPKKQGMLPPKPQPPSQPPQPPPKPKAKAKGGKKGGDMAPFVSHMSMEDAMKLSVHEKIDHRDQVGRFVFATVSEKQGSNLKIHYDGWSRKWDTWSDFSVELHRFAPAGSISLRPSHRIAFSSLKKGDYVDINPSQRHFGWKVGEIRRLDQKSGQVQVVYEYVDKNYLYWAHLDNMDEIAQFPSKSGVADADADAGADADAEQAIKKEDKLGKKEETAPAVVDEMEAWSRIRAKRFPRYAAEEICNKYGIGEWLEVQDTQTLQWITATVIDKENNWICVHFDGWPSKYDQKIHVIKHARRLRALGAELGETQEERDIREEMESFLKEVEQLNWKLATVDADGNCLYRCFAINIYSDTDKHMLVRRDCCQYMRENRTFFVNFIPDFADRMREKEAEYEWGDHVDITALSELYNVRVRVFEYDVAAKKLYMSFDLGEHEQTVNLPLILLARHRKKHYNIICDPQAVHKRPLGTATDRVASDNGISLRDIRLNEDAKEEHKEGADDSDDADDDASQMAQHEYYLTESEFVEILETYALSPPLNQNDLRNCFDALIKRMHKKLLQHAQKHMLDERIVNRFWETQNLKIITTPKQWLNELAEKIPNGRYPVNAALTSFNQSIVNSISDNLQAVIGQSRKRQSTIDVSRMQSQHQYQNQQQKLKQKAMDIDK